MGYELLIKNGRIIDGSGTPAFRGDIGVRNGKIAAIGKRLGVTVAQLIGHTAVRHYVMGNESQARTATGTEIEAMRKIVREGMLAGAIGLSINRNKGHYDPQGVHIPAYWADEDELFA